MRLFTPFTIPKKENCDLYRIKLYNLKQERTKISKWFCYVIVGKLKYKNNLFRNSKFYYGYLNLIKD